MRSLKKIDYSDLVIGDWYLCHLKNLNNLGYEEWYFKFAGYDENQSILQYECYSPYPDGSFFHLKDGVGVLCEKFEVIKGFRVVDKDLLDEKVRIGGLSW